MFLEKIVFNISFEFTSYLTYENSQSYKKKQKKKNKKQLNENVIEFNYNTKIIKILKQVIINQYLNIIKAIEMQKN